MVLAAALAGAVIHRIEPAALAAGVHRDGGHGDGGHGDGAGAAEPPARSVARGWGHVLRVTAVCLPLWGVPILVAGAVVGWNHVFVVEALFFSKMAVVTFGGAYAVLTYVAQQAVEVYGWMVPGDMLNGLGLAETTPGPLILVTQFVGFLAAFRDAGPLDPVVAGVLGAVLTTWVTFVPCFYWIFLGAPYVEALRSNRTLSAALSAVTAAVVGVVLNLTLWFALNVCFATVTEVWYGPLRVWTPALDTIGVVPVVLAAAALVAVLRFRVGVIRVLAAGAGLGVVMMLI